MPKAIQHLNYAAKEAPAAGSATPGCPSTSSTPKPRRPPGKTATSKAPGPESKQPKLVTLRASPSDGSEEEEEEEAGLKKPVWVGLAEDNKEGWRWTVERGGGEQ